MRGGRGREREREGKGERESKVEREEWKGREERKRERERDERAIKKAPHTLPSLPREELVLPENSTVGDLRTLLGTTREGLAPQFVAVAKPLRFRAKDVEGKRKDGGEVGESAIGEKREENNEGERN